MKNNNKSDFDNLMLIAQGHVASQCLMTGLDLNLFELLNEKGALSRSDIMLSLNIAEIPAKILLRALYSLDLLLKKDDLFSNSDIAKEYLLASSSLNFKDAMGWQEKIVYPGIVHLTESIRNNTNSGLKEFKGTSQHLYGRLSETEGLEQVFQKSMTALSNSANQEFYQQCDLSASKVIVDVGGGEGLI